MEVRVDVYRGYYCNSSNLYSVNFDSKILFKKKKIVLGYDSKRVQAISLRRSSEAMQKEHMVSRSCVRNLDTQSA